MKIIQLKAENFKRLKAVDITPKDDVVIISGGNEQGKTSVLDAIWAVVDGAGMAKSTGTEQPIHTGKDNAEVTLDIGEFVLKRRWTAKGSTLTVMGRDGAKHASPQKIIDSFMAAYTIDPVALCNAKPAELKDFLLRFVKFDFPKYQADRKHLFESRTIANRDADNAGKVLAAMPVIPNLPDEEITPDQVMAKISDVQAVKDQNRDIRFELEQATKARESLESEFAQIQKQIVDMEVLLAKLKDEQEFRKNRIVAAKEMESAAGEMVAAIVEPDQTALQAELENINRTNAQVREKKIRAQKTEELEGMRKICDGLTAKIAALDATKDEAFKSAKLPVDGLTVTEDSVLFKGVPFTQASSEERLRVSVGLAMMSNPKLKVLRIKDASLLDKKHMAVLQEMVREKGFQAWLEVVDESGEIGFLVEDGELASPERLKELREAARK